MSPGRYWVGIVALLIASHVSVRAEESIELSKLDQKVYDTLRELHNQAADLYNAKDVAGSYRFFEASLKFARAMLDHRPLVQKFIDEGLAETEKQSSLAKKTYSLHELIEKVRDRIHGEGKPVVKKDSLPELLLAPPREFKEEPQSKKAPKIDLLLRLDRGIGGKVVFKGKFLPDVEVVFVSRNQPSLRVYETISNKDGYYLVETLPPGMYTVLLTPGKDCVVKQLPVRYSTVTTSPLIIDAKTQAETMDFVLQ